MKDIRNQLGTAIEEVIGSAILDVEMKLAEAIDSSIRDEDTLLLMWYMKEYKG